MNTKLYVFLPIIAFLVILINAFFGHLLFDFSPEQSINKYSVYIHLQSQWESYPKNIIYSVTSVWDNPQTNSNDPYYEPEIEFQHKTEYNTNELFYIDDKAYVELKHEFSDCKNEWKPILYRRVVDGITSYFSNLLGNQKNLDPYIVKYPIISNEKFSKEDFESGFSYFIPICTVKESTSYEYSIKVNDVNMAFDVYVVPSIQELNNFRNNNDFVFFQDDGCYGKNFQMFTGFCENLNEESGLLIVTPDKLNYSVTKISVNLHEIKKG